MKNMLHCQEYVSLDKKSLLYTWKEKVYFCAKRTNKPRHSDWAENKESYK